MKFIDLFAGLGGFHLALNNLGHECVFASELDPNLRRLYKQNFGFEPDGDIKNIYSLDIPEHDILAAGFPCQAFSKAGSQSGLDDFNRGTLFDDIARILKYRKPKYFILENVPNIEKHDNGRTWDIISTTLRDTLEYDTDFKKLSPHQFGIPQLRERMFIVGARDGLSNFNWPTPIINKDLSIRQILDENENNRLLPERELRCLNVWQEFIDRIPDRIDLPSFPIWSMEFGATYPIDGIAPYHLKKEDLDSYLGAFGQSLHGMNHPDQLERIPKYARVEQEDQTFPRWKQRFILQNRDFYATIKRFVDPILPEIQRMPPSWQKLEWNCRGQARDIFTHIVQFRGSGIRVKRSNYSPSLVSSTSTQIPVITWENRYISIKEASRLQSMEQLELPNQIGPAFKALGNAVNVYIVELIANRLITAQQPLNGGSGRTKNQSEIQVDYGRVK